MSNFYGEVFMTDNYYQHLLLQTQRHILMLTAINGVFAPSNQNSDYHPNKTKKSQ